jgi:hypothetical protein
MERETGIEPATFSLGRRQSIGNKEHSVSCISFWRLRIPGFQSVRPSQIKRSTNGAHESSFETSRAFTSVLRPGSTRVAAPDSPTRKVHPQLCFRVDCRVVDLITLLSRQEGKTLVSTPGSSGRTARCRASADHADTGSSVPPATVVSLVKTSRRFILI